MDLFGLSFKDNPSFLPPQFNYDRVLGCLYLLMAFHIPEVVENIVIIPYAIILGALSIYSLWLAVLFAIDADKKRQAQLRGR